METHAFSLVLNLNILLNPDQGKDGHPFWQLTKQKGKIGIHQLSPRGTTLAASWQVMNDPSEFTITRQSELGTEG